MLVPNMIRFAATLMVVASFTVARGQQVTAEQKSAAIQNIAKEIAANYVYPEKGGQIASHIRTAHFKGNFDKANTWQEFNQMVTNELRSFSRDGHLYVRHDPAIVKDLSDHVQSGGSKSVLDEPAGSSSVISEARVMDGNVGYLKIPQININRNNLQDIYDAMKKVEGTKALIIDVRNNGGGGSEVGPVLESYFLPPGVPTLQFTKRDGNVFTDSTVNWLKEPKYGKPVYILVNRGTASAAEAFAFVLQQNRRAKVVGERTAGAAYMNSWYAVDDENFVSVSTAAPSFPGKNTSWELEGIQPEIKVKKGDALEVALREASKN